MTLSMLATSEEKLPHVGGAEKDFSFIKNTNWRAMLGPQSHLFHGTYAKMHMGPME